jgi:hypothetical protein
VNGECEGCFDIGSYHYDIACNNFDCLGKTKVFISKSLQMMEFSISCCLIAFKPALSSGLQASTEATSTPYIFLGNPVF